MTNRFRKVSLVACTGVVSAMLALVPQAATAAGTTYFVDGGGGSATCSDGNAGTDSGAPLCTIGAAAKKAVAGDTVQVAAGSYREQVKAPAGVAFRGRSSSVVLGSENLPAGSWSSTSSAAWAATPGWTVAPSQVHVDSALLARAPDLAGVATANTWFWDTSTTPATLLVNTDGGNPGDGHDVEVTVRQYGFLLRGVSGVTVDGFTLDKQGGAGVNLDTGATGNTVRDVVVTESASYGISDSGGSDNSITGVHTTDNGSIGIRIQNATGDVVSSSTSEGNRFHGVSVQGGSGNTVQDVTARANVRPGARVAAGIDVSSSSVDVVVQRNRTWGNDDSGIEIYTGSSGALVRDNLSYDNNDHGIDISVAPGAVVVSNTVVGNNSSGINVEGGSTNTLVRNNIAVDNTAIPDRSKGDIRVDPASTSGTTLDHDLVFQKAVKTTPIFEWDGITYTDFSKFRAASGQEAHGTDDAPAFVSLSGRDLRLSGDSPAVDSADAAVTGWSDTDLAGRQPVDNPTVAQDGTGSPSFADLGALEFVGAYAQPPVVRVTSTDGLTLSVDATNSGTLGEPISQRTIDCGNGQAPVSGAAVECVYPGSGDYTVTVRVEGRTVNGSSWADTAAVPVHAARDEAPRASLSLSSGSIVDGGSVRVDASGSSDDHGIVSYRIDCGNGGPVATTATTTCRYPDAGSYTVSLEVTDTVGHTATAAEQVRVLTPPTAALTLSGTETRQGEPITVDASGSTPGSADIVSWDIDCGDGTPHAPAVGATRQCRYDSAGSFQVSVTVTDARGNSDSARQEVVVGAAAAPVAALGLSRTRVRQGERTTLDASASTGTAASAVAGYRFRCGHHPWTSWQTGARTRCAFRETGRHRVRVEVRNTYGAVGAVARTVRVVRGIPPTARLVLSSYRVHRGRRVVAMAGASTGTRVSEVVAYRFGCGNGHSTGWQQSARASCRYGGAGRHTVRVWVRSSLGLVDVARRLVRVRR